MILLFVTIVGAIFPNNFKPSQYKDVILNFKTYIVKGHKNPDLLSFKTPVESQLINQEMKIRGLKKGIKVLSKNILTHQNKAAKAETQKELTKQNTLTAKRLSDVSQLKILHTQAKAKLKTMINAIPPQMKPIIVKKLRLEHRL